MRQCRTAPRLDANDRAAGGGDPAPGPAPDRAPPGSIPVDRATHRVDLSATAGEADSSSLPNSPPPECDSPIARWPPRCCCSPHAALPPHQQKRRPLFRHVQTPAPRRRLSPGHQPPVIPPLELRAADSHPAGFQTSEHLQVLSVVDKRNRTRARTRPSSRRAPRARRVCLTFTRSDRACTSNFQPIS